MINPEGVLLVSGWGAGTKIAGSQEFAMVLKMLKKPRDASDALDPGNMAYWKRELEACRSGLLARLPAAIAAPRCFGVQEQAETGAIWMEYIQPAHRERWGVAEYTFAARMLGQFHGAYLGGLPLPEAPWLCHHHPRTWAGGNQPPAQAFEHEVIARFFSPQRSEMQRLWDEQERFFAALERLPQVFSHFDFQRRNLVIRQGSGGQKQLVALDWSMCGIGALGGDLSSLLGLSALLAEITPAEVRTFEPQVFAAYLDGLRSAGWQGNPAFPRLGFTAWLAIYFGFETGWTQMWAAQPERAARQFGKPIEALAADWAELNRYALERAAEARALMTETG